MSDHKYESKSGYPTFWNHIIDAVEFSRDSLHRPHYTNAHEDPTLKNKQPVQRCICSNCESHLGHIFDDGPAPFFKRFMVNSASLSFEAKPWFTIPDFTREEANVIRDARKNTAAGKKAWLKLIHDEKMMGIQTFVNRQKAEKGAATIAKKKKA